MKKKLKIILKLGTVLLLTLTVYVLGIYSYSNESIRTFISSKYLDEWRYFNNMKYISYTNYNLGKKSSPPSLELIIPDSSKQILNTCRSNALVDNLLRNENKIEVAAQLVHLSDTFNVSIRLKGDYSDHWIGDKWSYRIKIKGKNRLFGMKSFSIQAPDTRKNLSEWYFHKLMKREGLIALRYGFISLNQNGVDKGIYAIEESFAKQLIEYNNRREAPILKFDESILIDQTIINQKNTYSQDELYQMSKIDVFKSKRTLKSKTLYDQYRKGKELLSKLRDNQIPLKEAIDIDKAAKLFAIADITNGHHALRWKNVRFYYNPVIGKLELIGFDAMLGHNHIKDIYYNMWKTNKLGVFDVKSWKDIFYKDPLFQEKYFFHLARYSEAEYLKAFHDEIKGELDLNLTYIHKDNSNYPFFLDKYTTNALMISEKINNYNRSLDKISNDYFVQVTAESPFQFNDSQISLSIINKANQNLDILGIFDTAEQKISTDIILLAEGKLLHQNANKQPFVFNLKTPLDTNQIKLKRNDNSWVYKQIKLGYTYHNCTDTFYKKIEHHYDSKLNINLNSTNNLSSFKFNHKLRKVSLEAGQYTFTNNIVLPYGYEFLVMAGTEITLNNNAVFSVNGAINLIGEEKNRISFKSDDSSGSILVCQAKKESVIKYTDFYNLSDNQESNWDLTGAVNFYEADVIISNSTFSNNNSEDALNIVRSTFILSNSSFTNIKSDAFDGDFCFGNIQSSTFDKIGNDAIDFSGSLVTLKDLTINQVGDKGVSAGEMSKIVGSKVIISNTELGLVSKDSSYLHITHVSLDNVSVGYTVFQKKQIFGPAIIELVDYKIEGFKEEFLVEIRSKAKTNGDLIQPNHTDVLSILYGNQYGKSSN